MADNSGVSAEASAAIEDLGPPPPYIANISYHMTIKTGDKPSAGTDANVYFALHGNKGETPRITLQDESQPVKRFQRRRTDKFAVQTTDIGKLEKLVIGHDNKGQDPAWYLEEVDVNIPVRDEHYKFRYSGWLGGEPDQRKEAVLIPDISHHITIKTGDKPSAGTDANVYIALHGDKGETPRITLQDESQTLKRFQRRRADKFTVQTAGIGKLEKLVIGHDNKGQDPAWYLEEVDVNIPVRDEHYKFRYSGWLGGEPDQRKEAVLFPGPPPQASQTPPLACPEMPPPYTSILMNTEDKGLSPQAPGTHPTNLASTASVPAPGTIPLICILQQFRVTCGHCSETFVIYTARRLAKCPHCRKKSSVGYFAENHATIFGILGFIFLAAGVGVTVATLNRARNSGGYYVIWVGAFVSAFLSLIRCCYYCSMKVSLITEDSATETAHALREQTTSMSLQENFNL